MFVDTSLGVAISKLIPLLFRVLLRLLSRSNSNKPRRCSKVLIVSQLLRDNIFWSSWLEAEVREKLKTLEMFSSTHMEISIVQYRSKQLATLFPLLKADLFFISPDFLALQADCEHLMCNL